MKQQPGAFVDVREAPLSIENDERILETLYERVTAFVQRALPFPLPEEQDARSGAHGNCQGDRGNEYEHY